MSRLQLATLATFAAGTAYIAYQSYYNPNYLAQCAESVCKCVSSIWANASSFCPSENTSSTTTSYSPVAPLPTPSSVSSFLETSYDLLPSPATELPYTSSISELLPTPTPEPEAEVSSPSPCLNLVRSTVDTCLKQLSTTKQLTSSLVGRCVENLLKGS